MVRGNTLSVSTPIWLNHLKLGTIFIWDIEIRPAIMIFFEFFFKPYERACRKGHENLSMKFLKNYQMIIFNDLLIFLFHRKVGMSFFPNITRLHKLRNVFDARLVRAWRACGARACVRARLQ